MGRTFKAFKASTLRNTIRKRGGNNNSALVTKKYDTSDKGLEAIENWVSSFVNSNGMNLYEEDITTTKTGERLDPRTKGLDPRTKDNSRLIQMGSSGNKNDCLIHSFLTSTSGTFRKLRKQDKDVIANYFRRIICTQIMDDMIINKDKLFDEPILHRIKKLFKSNSPLEDHHISVLAHRFAIGFFLYKNENEQDFIPRRINEQVPFPALYIMIYNPSNIHFDSLQKGGRYTFETKDLDTEYTLYHGDVNVDCPFNFGNIIYDIKHKRIILIFNRRVNEHHKCDFIEGIIIHDGYIDFLIKEHKTDPAKRYKDIEKIYIAYVQHENPGDNKNGYNMIQAHADSFGDYSILCNDYKGYFQDIVYDGTSFSEDFLDRIAENPEKIKENAKAYLAQLASGDFSSLAIPSAAAEEEPAPYYAAPPFVPPVSPVVSIVPSKTTSALVTSVVVPIQDSKKYRTKLVGDIITVNDEVVTVAQENNMWIVAFPNVSIKDHIYDSMAKIMLSVSEIWKRFTNLAIYAKDSFFKQIKLAFKASDRRTAIASFYKDNQSYMTKFIKDYPIEEETYRKADRTFDKRVVLVTKRVLDPTLRDRLTEVSSIFQELRTKLKDGTFCKETNKARRNATMRSTNISGTVESTDYYTSVARICQSMPSRIEQVEKRIQTLIELILN